MNLFFVAAAPVKSPNEDVIVLIGLIGFALIVIGTVIWRDRRRSLGLRERELAAFRERSDQDQTQRERDSKAYSQHVALNELTAKKIELETKLMQAQLDTVERDRTARDHHEDYQRLMIQKTELEIQSLKLHIREQRKRIDDFTSYDDE